MYSSPRSSAATFLVSLSRKGLFIGGAKRQPISFGRLCQTIPVALEAVGQLLHVAVERLHLPHCTQVVTICFVLRQTDDLPFPQLHQQCDVSFSYRRAQLAPSRQSFGL